jgi:hypothetical protein
MCLVHGACAIVMALYNAAGLMTPLLYGSRRGDE